MDTDGLFISFFSPRHECFLQISDRHTINHLRFSMNHKISSNYTKKAIQTNNDNAIVGIACPVSLFVYIYQDFTLEKNVV